MPRIRLHNPKGRRTKRAAPRRHVVRRKNSLGEGVLSFMANPKHKRKRSSNRKRKPSAHRTILRGSRRSNPKYATRKPRRRKQTHPMLQARRHRRRRNPIAAFADLKRLAFDAAYLAGGGVTARSVPQLLLAQYNTGFLGYGLNLLTGVVTSALIGKWRGPQAARPWLLGAFAFTLSRVIDDYAGLKILSFAQFTPGATPMLAGDASYGMRGVYASMDFPLPSNSLTALPPGRSSAVPAAVPVSEKAGMGWDGSFN